MTKITLTPAQEAGMMAHMQAIVTLTGCERAIIIVAADEADERNELARRLWEHHGLDYYDPKEFTVHPRRGAAARVNAQGAGSTAPADEDPVGRAAESLDEKVARILGDEPPEMKRNLADADEISALAAKHRVLVDVTIRDGEREIRIQADGSAHT